MESKLLIKFDKSPDLKIWAITCMVLDNMQVKESHVVQWFEKLSCDLEGPRFKSSVHQPVNEKLCPPSRTNHQVKNSAHQLCTFSARKDEGSEMKRIAAKEDWPEATRLWKLYLNFYLKC